MKLKIYETKEMMGKAASEHATRLINEAIAECGSARILLSTGASQFPFFEWFVKEDIEWDKVEMFHLDEYVGIDPEQPASFNKYLRERFIDKVKPGKYHLIDGRVPADETIKELTALLAEKAVDVGLIGIGENAHIAFNDPPADFNDTRAYKVVTLDDRCLMQQIGEGWFKDKDECFKQAISMTCPEIMKCKHIISVVPYKVKAEAVYKTVTSKLTPEIPATLLKEHADSYLYCDADSSALLTEDMINAHK